MAGNQTDFLHALGWALLNSFWQMAILWMAWQCIFLIHKKASATTRSTTATFFLTAGFVWFLITLTGAFTGSASIVVSDKNIINTIYSDTESRLLTILPYASALYLLLLIFPLLHFIRNYRYVGVIRKYGLSKIDVQWRLFVQKIAAQMGIRKPVKIWVSEYVSSPVTIGFLKPVILVPLAAINHLSPQQMEAVLLHELSHIKRYDYLLNLLINFIKTLLYFNPFVNALVKIVEREREKSSDEMVLQFQYDSFEYASALLTLEKENHKQRLLALAAGGKKNDLLNRIETIMGVPEKRVISSKTAFGLLAGLLLIIATNVLLFVTKPGMDTRNIASLPGISSPFVTDADGLYAAELSPEQNPNSELLQGAMVSQAKDNETPENVVAEQSSVISNEPASKNVEPEQGVVSSENPYRFVNFDQLVIPELKRSQEEEVRKAMESSRKVLENAQWKMLENQFADVFTEKEKEELKNTYRNEVNKFDWQKWENKLKLAYNNIDWGKVNYQLENAINQIKIDSLQKVYTDVMVKLADVEKELSIKGMEGIPDTDLTLDIIEESRNEARKAINDLKKIRNKKVVSL
ncbi:MAG TPA: M56 family metallopeptidase [Chitinophagaceae bacterium]|nr:M56 family metallopeptidase [Chitinophagaceae bacterium]